MKLNWIRSKVAELNAEKNVTEKGLEYHHDIEDFVVRVFELLKKAQGSEDAMVFQWRGLKYDLSHEGVEELTKPTLAEGILMDILRTTDTGITVVQIEAKLVDLGNKAKPTTIVDYEDDEKEVPSSHRQEKEKEKGDKPAAEMPPPASVPATAGEKEKPPTKKTPTTKRMPKFPDKNTQGEDTSKFEVKKVKEEVRPWDEYFVPKEQLSVKVSQHVWSQLGIFSRQRLLKEHPTDVGEKCFACQKEGHRSYYCDTMITVAQRLSSFFNQPAGGQRAGQTVFCSCCWLYNMRQEKKRKGDYATVTGWFRHPRNMCNYKDSCSDLKADGEIAKMRHHELRAHLIKLQLLDKDEEKGEEKMKEKDTRKVEVVSEDEPEKKKRKKEEKKEKKDEEKKEKKERQQKEEEKKRQEEEAAKNKAKEEEEKKKKEAEEFKESLRGETTPILYGYLFDPDYRCTPRKLKEQARYEKELPYEVLVRTPNYIGRLEEANERNKRQIEEYKAKASREEKERILKEEEEKEKERPRKKAERKAASAEEKAKKKAEKKAEKKARKE